MHSITLIQGILLAIMAMICGFDFWLEGLYIFRPIIVCTLSGLILGDLHTGLVAGALTELAFAGLTPVGGTQPPNPILAGVMTTVIAYTSKIDAKTAIGLALPFSFLMQYIILFYYSAFSVINTKLEKYADEADTKSFARLNIITTLIVGVTYGVLVFLCAYVAQAPMKELVASMPLWLSHGFQIAGSILPAVGFGLLLKVMLKIEFVPCLIIGFVAASFSNFSNLLPVALIGVALAMYEFFNQKNINSRQPVVVNNEKVGDDYSEGI
ncbi:MULTISPECIES: PTS galactosamine transporter subunit IIC [Clostridium]|uniref:PTS galactosamine transporter subunit IIC n=1 Tax=Clostridium TaxID=1485 RepID=UPI0008267A18|nr:MULTISPECIES: PTS galactosamine transporter subunit IIC [Clostridium]PJI09215.1 PTS sucrose transporter subunit IIBC [Clostridium sp. CT7]